MSSRRCCGIRLDRQQEQTRSSSLHSRRSSLHLRERQLLVLSAAGTDNHETLSDLNLSESSLLKKPRPQTHLGDSVPHRVLISKRVHPACQVHLRISVRKAPPVCHRGPYPRIP